jgi:hypothetical protein
MGWLSGREKGSPAYSAVEHVALLSVMSQAADAFNCSESSPQWEEVYSQMCTEYYQSSGIWLSGALHGHFVDLYSSFKQGIRHLSVQDTEKKSPIIYTKGNDCCEEYMDALNKLLGLDAKNTIQRSGGAVVWRRCSCQCILATPLSLEVGNKLLVGCRRKRQRIRPSLRLIRRISSKSYQRRGRPRRRSILMRQKNCKAVAEASAQLVQAFQQFSTSFAQAENVRAMVEQKISSMKFEIM